MNCLTGSPVAAIHDLLQLTILAIPHPDDWREGTGLLQLLLLCISLFLILMPICFIRGLLKKRTFRKSIEESWKFATYGTFGIIGLLVALVFVVGVPFGVLNMIGLFVTGKQNYWLIIMPGLVLLYSVAGILWWKEVKSGK
jgi:hypothetical protein